MDEFKLTGISSCYGTLHLNRSVVAQDEELAHAVYRFLIEQDIEELREAPEPVMWDGEWDDEEDEDS